MDTLYRMENITLVSTFNIIFFLMYNVSAFQPEGYQGCYFHIFYTPALGKQFSTEKSNTGDVCKSICKSKAYMFAGVRSGECYCDNAVRTAKYTSGCDIVCPGRATEKCGGLYRVSVYSVEAEETPTTSIVTETSDHTTENSSNSTFVPESVGLEATPYPAVTFLLILAILCIVAVTVYIGVKRRHSCMGRTYAIYRKNSLKRYFDSTNGNYQRHSDADNRLSDVTRPTISHTNKLEANVNVNAQACSLDTPIYASIYKQRMPINKQVYNHIKDCPKPAVGDTYSPLSTIRGDGKTNNVIDTYSHIPKQNTGEPDEEKDIKKDQSYNTLHAVARLCDEKQLNDDIATLYDRTHAAFNRDEKTFEVDEYSHTNNAGSRSIFTRDES